MMNDKNPLSEGKQRIDLETASKLELIKNLIFGENIQEYESEFETLKADIQKKKKALEDLIEAVRTDLRMSIDDVSTDINIRITELEDKLESQFEEVQKDQIQKKELGDLLIELGERIRKK